MPEVGSVVGGTVFEERPLFLERPPLWTPAQLGDDLALWLDAQDESTLTKSDVDSDGTPEVEVWGDKSGNGFDATQTTEAERLEYVPDAINGHAAMLLDGVDDHMTTSMSVTQPMTDLVVIQDPSSGSVVLSGVTERVQFALAGKNFEQTAFAGSTLRGIQADPGAFHMHGLIADGATSELFRDGSSTGSGDLGTNDLEGTVLGSYYDGQGAFFAGLMGDVIRVRKRLTSPERDKAFGYLAHKYDLTDKLPSDHPYKESPPTV